MGPKKPSEAPSPGALPFGAGAVETTSTGTPPKKRAARPARKAKPKAKAEPTADAPAGEPKAKRDEGTAEPARSKSSPAPEAPAAAPSGDGPTKDGDGPRSNRRRGSRRGGRRGRGRGDEASNGRAEGSSGGATATEDAEGGAPGGADDERPSGRSERRRRWQERRRARKRNKGKDRPPGQGPRRDSHQEGGGESEKGGTTECEGVLILERANHGHLRSIENELIPTKNDVHVPPRLVQKLALREGSLIKGRWRRGQGRHKRDLAEVLTVDGKDPAEVRNLRAFKSLTSIDPDFHYAVGDGSGETSLRVVDLMCPVGRGQRGLIVAPPRSGKTVLLQQFAKAVEKIYPEVHLMVLLVDERPEEATEWRRTVERGQVFVSTNDEMHKRHVELAESVWKRCQRLVELGEDVILVLDSITRLGRAYNNVYGTSGKTMSGGIDSRALERPKQFFGSARNTETAGSLTILATALIETGSRMDQVIFEEFKGTGNMELVLSRRLADRRIFPAIDLERSGTRKEEKLISSRRLKFINTLRRVLTRMHWAEAMELLITKLDDVEKTDDFLNRFEVDPEA